MFLTDVGQQSIYIAGVNQHHVRAQLVAGYNCSVKIKMRDYWVFKLRRVEAKTATHYSNVTLMQKKTLYITREIEEMLGPTSNALPYYHEPRRKNKHAIEKRCFCCECTILTSDPG